MALLTIEFFDDGPETTNAPQCVYGTLISSVEDTSLSTTVEHAAVPDNALYCSIYTDTAAYIEIGSGNQDCAAGRRSTIPGTGQRYDFKVKPTDTVSYRSIA